MSISTGGAGPISARDRRLAVGGDGGTLASGLRQRGDVLGDRQARGVPGRRDENGVIARDGPQDPREHRVVHGGCHELSGSRRRLEDDVPMSAGDRDQELLGQMRKMLVGPDLGVVGKALLPGGTRLRQNIDLLPAGGAGP